MNPIILILIGIAIGLVLAVVIGAIAPDTTVGTVTASANKKITIIIATALLLVIGFVGWQQFDNARLRADFETALELIETIKSDGSAVAPKR